MTEQSAAGASGRPGKYQRSAAGLAVALLVTAVVVLGLVWFLGLFRAETTTEPEAIDYLTAVESLQDSGTNPVYPASLPEGWIATIVDVEAGAGGQPGVGLKFLTDEGRFVGIQQEEASVTSLLRSYVDEDAAEADGYRNRAAVAPNWDGYADDGGDTAYVAEIDEVMVLVYGSAPAEDLQQLIDLLTTEQVD